MKKLLFLFLFSVGIIFSATAVHAASCQFISEDNIGWGTGRVAGFNINVVNNNGCPSGWGATQGSVLLNDIPAAITSWGPNSVSVNVPSSVEGLANIKVIGNDGVTYGTSQLLISIKVNSYPSNIILGDSIEITGEGFNNSQAGKVVNLSVGGYSSSLAVVSWSDTRIVLSTDDSHFKIGNNTLKVYYGSDNQSNGYQSQSFDINVSAPLCTTASWSCNNWNTCSIDGNQTRSCNKVGICEGGVSIPETSQSCTYVPPVCTSWSYSGWFECKVDNTQTRNIISSYPNGCSGGDPTLIQGCSHNPLKPIIPPIIPQVQPSTCTADTWICGDWDPCSLSGVQSRSCRKTLDCPNIETAIPITDRYCESPNNPAPQDSNEVSNQNAIIKATATLDKQVSSENSGTGTAKIVSQQPSTQVQNGASSTVISDQAVGQNNEDYTSSTTQSQAKTLWFKHFFQWVASLF